VALLPDHQEMTSYASDTAVTKGGRCYSWEEEPVLSDEEIQRERIVH